jgi:DNA-binding NarL/FixJ family response regulator
MTQTLILQHDGAAAVLELGLPAGTPLVDALRRAFPGLRLVSPPRPKRAALTRRETEVLTFLAKGIAYAEIGALLGIGLGTVQSHIKRLYTKLEINNKAEAALVAAEMQLV